MVHMILSFQLQSKPAKKKVKQKTSNPLLLIILRLKSLSNQLEPNVNIQKSKKAKKKKRMLKTQISKNKPQRKTSKPCNNQKAAIPTYNTNVDIAPSSSSWSKRALPINELIVVSNLTHASTARRSFKERTIAKSTSALSTLPNIYQLTRLVQSVKSRWIRWSISFGIMIMVASLSNVLIAVFRPLRNQHSINTIDLIIQNNRK